MSFVLLDEMPDGFHLRIVDANEFAVHVPVRVSDEAKMIDIAVDGGQRGSRRACPFDGASPTDRARRT